MNTSFRLFVLLFLFLSHFLQAQDTELQDKVIRYIKKEQFKALHNQFDRQLADELSAREMRYIWKRLVKQLGVFKDQGKTTLIEKEGHRTYNTPLYFEKGKLELQTAFTPGNRISGIYFRPFSYSLPSYGSNLVYNLDQIVIKSGNFKMPGELILPKKMTSKPPLVIFVHGSGPNDRYESVSSAKVFKDLMLGLVSNNVACLLYDKRTMVYESHYDTCRFTLYEETIEDAVNAYHLARTRTDIDTAQIFIAGHSLGGYALPKILAACKGVKGGIVMAGCARPLEAVIKDQYLFLAGMDGKIRLGEQFFLYRENKKIKRISEQRFSGLKPASRILAYWPVTFWKDIKDYDPLLTLKNQHQPVLFLQGDRDYQVTEKDLKIWKSAYLEKKNWSFISYPKLNHLFIEGEGQPNPIEYFSGGNVPEYVIKDMVNWLNSNL